MRTNLLNGLSNVVKKGAGLACSWSQVGRMSGEGAIEHPLSTHSAPFGTRWKPAGEKGSTRVWKHVAMIFAVLVMSRANVGMAWGATVTMNSSIGTSATPLTTSPYIYNNTSVGAVIYCSNAVNANWTKTGSPGSASGEYKPILYNSVNGTSLTTAKGLYSASGSNPNTYKPQSTKYYSITFTNCTQVKVSGTGGGTASDKQLAFVIKEGSTVIDSTVVTSKKDLNNPESATSSTLSPSKTYTLKVCGTGANDCYILEVAFYYPAASPWTIRSNYTDNNWSTNRVTMTGTTTVTGTWNITTAGLYEFKVVDTSGSGTWYGNGGNIGCNVSGWTFSTGESSNCKFFASETGNYTFTFNTSTKKLSVTYPTAQGKYYYKNTNSWGTVAVYRFKGGINNGGTGTIVTETETVCGDTYYFTYADPGTTLIFNCNSWDCKTGDMTASGNAGKYVSGTGSSWNTFTTYTISYAANGGGGSMSSETGICPSGSQVLTSNAFSAPSGCASFSHWTANVNVTANGTPVTAGNPITDGATLSGISSDITLTAVWKLSAPTITKTPLYNTFTISGSMAGSSYKYSTDGTTPTTAYSSAVAFDADITAKAIATKSGYADSDVASLACTYNNCSISSCGNATLTYTINGSTSVNNTAANLVSATNASNTTALGVPAASSAVTLSTMVFDGNAGKAVAKANGCYTTSLIMSSKLSVYNGSAFNTSHYLQFAFTVKEGYTFTPCDIQFVVQPTSYATDFRWEVTDGTSTYGYGTASGVGTGSDAGATVLTGLTSPSMMSAGTYYIRLYPKFKKDGKTNDFRIGDEVILKGTTAAAACTAPTTVDVSATVNSVSGYWFYLDDAIVLTAAPTGSPSGSPVTYQWKKGGVNIVGATSSTYSIASAAAADAGKYTCTISYGACSTTSSDFELKCMQFYLKNSDGGDISNHVLVKEDATHASLTLGLTGGTTYKFRVTDGCGNWYGNTGEMTSSSCTNWTMPHNADCRVTTNSTTGDYTFLFDFTVGLLGSEMKVSVVYPGGDQAADKVIYWDNSVLNWAAGNQWYRIGTKTGNTKTQMMLVPGTANLYKVTTGEYNGFQNWHIANNQGEGTGNVFWTKDSDPATNEEITAAMAYDGVAVTSVVTVTPTTTHATGETSDNNNCQFYTYSKMYVMKTDNVAISEYSNGTVTVAYTDTEDAAQSFTSGNRDLAHTVILTVTAVPNTGYNLSALTVGGSAHTSGNTYTCSGNTTVSATFAANNYTVTLNNQSATTAGTKSVTATYNASTNLTSSISCPDKTGYTFGGYYTETGGHGLQLIDKNGDWNASITGYTDASKNWIHVGSVTLYARWIACSAYSFHSASSGAYPWGSTCFEQVGSSHIWQIENFVIPSATKYYVGYQEDFWNADLGDGEVGEKSKSEEKSWTDTPTKISDSYWNGAVFLVPASGDADVEPDDFACGQATGAKGTLLITDNVRDYNLYVRFKPNGYGLTYAAGVKAFSYVSDHLWQTDIVTLTSADVAGTFKVGLATATAGTYVDCALTSEYDADDMNAHKDVLVSGQSYPAIPDMAASQEGRFVIWDNSNGGQWYLSFLPVYTVQYNGNGSDGGSAPAAATKYRTNETPTVLANTYTRTGYTFAGWNTVAGGGGDSYAAGASLAKIGANVTLYAQWTANTYDVTHTFKNVSRSGGGSGGMNAATYGTDYSVTVAASSGYVLPSTITVTIGGAATTHYTWNSSTGVVTVDGNYILGAVVITITGEEEDTPCFQMVATTSGSDATLTHNDAISAGSKNCATLSGGTAKYIDEDAGASQKMTVKSGESYGWNFNRNKDDIVITLPSNVLQVGSVITLSGYANSSSNGIQMNGVTLYTKPSSSGAFSDVTYTVKIGDTNLVGKNVLTVKRVSGGIYLHSLAISNCQSATPCTTPTLPSLSNQAGCSYSAWNATPTNASTITSAGESISYSWKKGATEKATTASYTPDADGTDYTVTVTVSKAGSISTSVTSSALTSTKYGNPTVTGPSDAEYEVGESASNLSVTATPDHGESLTYQWYSNTAKSTSSPTPTVLENCTTSTYKPSTAATGTTYYFCKVSGGCADVYSSIATVTVSEVSCFKFKCESQSSGVSAISSGSAITTSSWEDGKATLTGGTMTNSGSASLGVNKTYGIVLDGSTKEVTVTLGGDNTLAVGSVITLKAGVSDADGSQTSGLVVSGNTCSPASYTSSTAGAAFTQTYTVTALDGLAGTKSFTIAKKSDLVKTYLNGITVTGCEEVVGYTIAFEGNGNTGGSMSDVTEIEEGDNVTLDPNGFTKNGYTFANWTADVAVTVNSATVAVGDPIADEATIQNVTSDITLTAQWTPNTYGITYHLNGASWAGAYDAPATYTVGTGATLPVAGNMTNTGYTFNGWYDNSSLTGSSISAISTSDYGNKEFWAKWTENTYTITYKKNGDGAGNDGDVTGSTSSTNGHYVIVADNGFALASHVFAGWNTAANGSGESYSEGEEIELTDDMTLYAIWADDYNVTWGKVQIGGAGDAVTPNLGGKNYTITATISSWDGDTEDIELGDVTEGVIASITGTTATTVTITFAVGTDVVGEEISLSLNVPAHGDYGVKTSTKAITIDRCTGGKDEIRFISSNKNDAGDNFADMSTTKNTTQYVGSDIAKLIATGSAGLNLANNKIGYRFDRLNVVFKLTTTTTLDVYYNANATNKTFALYSFSSDKELSAIGTSDYSTKSIVSSGITVTNVSFSEGSKSTPAGTNSVSSGVVKLVTAGGIKASYASLAAGYYVLISGSGEEGYLYGLDITGGSGSGKITPTLTWSPLVSSDAAWDGVNNRLNKRTSDADFTFTATQDKNSLGAITYASSNTSVVTVNATTGKVHVEGAGDATITATLAESGCYNKATATYAIHVVDDCDDEAGTISTEDLGCDGIRMTVTGHTTSGETVNYQWYKDGVSLGSASGAQTATYTATTAGEYYVIVTNTGDRHCAKTSTNTVVIAAKAAVTASKIVDSWYVKNGRRTPDIALVQTTNTTDFTVAFKGSTTIWDPTNSVSTGFGGCPFRLGADGIIYLDGQSAAGEAPTGMTVGDTTITITAKGCGAGNELSVDIKLHVQAATDRKSVAFVVDGTEKGRFDQPNADHSTNSALYQFLDYTLSGGSGHFDLTAQNIYSSVDEKEIREHFSQFDGIIITDDPNTGKKKDGKSYVNAFGTMIDVRPILTMEAFVSKLANWKAKGINGNPESPNPRQYAMTLQCKDHEIFFGIDPTSPNVAHEEIDGVDYWTVTMVDKNKSPYAGKSDTEDTDGTPALQGFSASDVSGLLLLGEIMNGDKIMYTGVERQKEPAARLMLLGIQNKALPNALTTEGKTIIENAVEYLLKTNMEEVDDCSNYFIGGGGDNSWETDANWFKGKAPNSPMIRARILAPCEVSSTVHAAHIDIVTSGTSSKKSGEMTGKLTINPTGALIVGGEVRTAKAPYFNKNDLMPTDTNNLVINTNSTNQAALIFNNDAADTKATVNLYSLGRKEGGVYQFQYFAVPMEYVDVNPAFAGSGIYTYVWHEASGWERRGYYTGLEAFEGVGITTKFDEASHNYTMKGTLASTADKEIALTAETNGQNIVGNSWTAPIQISKLEEDNGSLSNKTVYIYNTGNDETADDGYGTKAGQWIAIPFEAAEFGEWDGLKVIPAMQSFTIMVDGASTLTLDYDKVVRGASTDMNAKLRAPKREASHEGIDLIRIRVADSQTHTDLYLFEGDSFSEEFDNGWEAKYMSGDGRSAKLYAETAIGPMAVVAQPEYEGTVLGFAPGKETEYTFTFSGPNKEYYLNDLKEKKSTLISEDESYMFTFEEGDTNRFYISKTPINAPSVATGTENTGDGTKARKVLVNDKLYIILNGRVYSAEGVMVK